MLLEKDLKKILDLFIREDAVQFSIDNTDISIRHFDEASKAIFSTTVYSGDNFIPPSVRKCAHQNHMEYGRLKTSLSIDENKFQITLIHLEEMDGLNRHNFSQIIQEFVDIAEKWRAILDENDRNDLVYIHSKL